MMRSPIIYSIKLWLRNMKKRRASRFALYFLGLMLGLGMFSGILATDQPLFASYKGNWWFPALTNVWDKTRGEIVTDDSTGVKETLQFDIVNWKTTELDFVIWAPIPWSPDKSDPLNRDYSGPFSKQFTKLPSGEIVESPWFHRHHFGTDQLGNDVLSGIIHGASISIQIGLLSAFIAGIIGLLLGALSGYFGDDRLSLSRASLIFSIPGLFVGYFWAFQVRSYALTDAMKDGFLSITLQIFWSIFLMFIVVACFFFIGRLFSRLKWLGKTIIIPFDNVIQRITEVFISMPRLLVILTIAAVFREKSVAMVITIIGITHWTSIARFTRAEMLRVRDLEYVEAARAMGFPWYRIVLRHALPGVIGPAMIEIIFLISGSILIESSLSFLGIGVPDDIVTWGSILNAGRMQIDAWWMVVFPGIFIFFTILSLNVFGDSIRKQR
jgi:peptide/nickel transport system permease protein